MKKTFLFALVVSCASMAWGQYSMVLHRSSGKRSSANCETLDSIKCGKTVLKFYKSSETSDYSFSSLDSITFVNSDDLIPRDTVYVKFSDNDATIVNPYEDNLQITKKGACVTVNSTTIEKDIVYSLSGKSSDGSFVIDSEHKFKVILDGLTLTSKQTVAPIRSFSGKTMSVILKGDNSLTDSASDTSNAVMRSKGQIIFEKSNGSLTVNAKQKRAIQSGDYIEIQGGTIVANSELGDCVRTNDYFLMKDGKVTLNGGGVNVTNGYFQMDGGSLALKSDVDTVKLIDIETEFIDEEGDTIYDATHGAFYLNGGDLSFEATGVASRFIKVDGDVTVKGGSISGSLAGASVYDATDGVTNATVIKADGTIQMLGGVHDLRVLSSAIGGRVLSSTKGIVFDGGVDMQLRNSAPVYSYTTVKGLEKEKESSLIKTDGRVTFKKCDLYVVSDAKEDGAYGMVADGDMTVEKDANVHVESYSSDAVFVDKDASGKLIVNDGYFSAFSMKGKAVSENCPVWSNGGIFVILSPQKSCGGFLNSAYTVLQDKSYDNTPIKVESEDGKTIFVHKGAFSSELKTGVVYVGGPFVKDETYFYTLGGKVSGTSKYSGFVTSDASYSGGDEYEVTASYGGGSSFISK